MPPRNKPQPAELSNTETSRDTSPDTARLLEMGITESAIMTYRLRVAEGQPADRALNALLEGRSLSTEQTLLVRAVLSRFARL